MTRSSADVASSYLILFRPPVRDLCVDALEDLYRNRKWRRDTTQNFFLDSNVMDRRRRKSLRSEASDEMETASTGTGTDERVRED